METSEIELVSVYEDPSAKEFLYDTLKERTPDQSISHKRMPTRDEHEKFYLSKPYEVWYLIYSLELGVYVGSTYLTRNREIGIFIRKEYQGKNYGTFAVNRMARLYPGPIYANINPKNDASIKFFERLGARHIQNTYEL